MSLGADQEWPIFAAASPPLCPLTGIMVNKDGGVCWLFCSRHGNSELATAMGSGSRAGPGSSS